MEMLDLLNEESVSGARGSRASLSIRREVLLFEKVSQLLRYDSNIFSSINTHIYKYMDTRPDHITPDRACACGVIMVAPQSSVWYRHSVNKLGIHL